MGIIIVMIIVQLFRDNIVLLIKRRLAEVYISVELFSLFGFSLDNKPIKKKKNHKNAFHANVVTRYLRYWRCSACV